MAVMVAPFCAAQTQKSKPRFQIFSLQVKTAEEALGVPRLGDVIPFKVLVARVAVHDKPDRSGYAPTPPKILCYFYDEKKELVTLAPGIALDPGREGKPDAARLLFRPRVPTDAFFPYDAKTQWRYAIVVVGDDEEIAVRSYPVVLRSYDEFAFPEKKLLEKK